MEVKRRNGFFSEEIQKAILQLVLFLVVYTIFFRTGLDKNINFQFIHNDYIREKVKDNIIIVVIGILYFLIFNIIANIARFVTKPVNLYMSLEDLHDHDDHTTMYHFSSGISDFKSGVKLTLEINKSNSLWNWVALKILKNKFVEVLICVEPRDGGICCLPESICDEYRIYETDFGINVSGLLQSNLVNNVPFKQEYKFLLEENRDKPITGNGSYPIKPILLINSKKIGFYYKRIIKINSNLERGYYPVKFAIHQTRR